MEGTDREERIVKCNRGLADMGERRKGSKIRAREKRIGLNRRQRNKCGEDR